MINLNIVCALSRFKIKIELLEFLVLCGISISNVVAFCNAASAFVVTRGCGFVCEWIQNILRPLLKLADSGIKSNHGGSIHWCLAF